MYSVERKDSPSLKDLEGRIEVNLLTAIQALASVNVDVSLYLYHHEHAAQYAHRDPLGKNGLDEAYDLYERQSNDSRRWWMRLRAVSEKRVKAANDPPPSTPSKSRPDTEASSSPLNHQSALDEDEGFESRRNNQVIPMDVDPTGHIPRSPTPTANQRSLNSNHEKIPKGVKLSVEITGTSTSQKPFVKFKPPRGRGPIVKESETHALNRAKNNRRDPQPSKDSPVSRYSRQSSSQHAGPSRTLVSVSPREGHVRHTLERDRSSARKYWVPRRVARPGDFHMDKSRLFDRLDRVGPRLQVNMAEITHRAIRATQTDLRVLYGGKLGLTPNIAPEKLANHGFDHWMTPNMDFHPFLPAQPGWPGLMLRSDDNLEEWRPEGGSAFRVVVKHEPNFIEYIGQYEMVRLDDITEDEWNQQDANVKKKWTQVLGGGQSWNDVIVRIALRKKLGKEPSTVDLENFTDGFSPKSYMELAKEFNDDVDRAFCGREEVIAVWGMKCVGYDFKFEKHLACSLKTLKPKRSLASDAVKKRKAAAGEAVTGGAEGEDEGEEPEPDAKGKGKAKLARYDRRLPGESEDEDYKPA